MPENFSARDSVKMNVFSKKRLGIDDGVGKLAVELKLPPVGNAAESHATNAKFDEKNYVLRRLKQKEQRALARKKTRILVR